MGESTMAITIDDASWRTYEQQGFLRIGHVLRDDELAVLCERIDRIMMGEADLPYDRMLMQLDAGTLPYDAEAPQSKGFKGPTLNYRKIEQLELDLVFLEYIRRPIFEQICRRVYGAKPVAVYRTMFMNKPAGAGTFLRWHQDRWTSLDRDPQLTIYTALDAATVENGCVQIIRGSHHRLINPQQTAGFLEDDQMAEHCPEDKVEFLELEAGEVALLHNWMLHRSDVNRSDRPRRALSVCMMDAATRWSGNGEPAGYPVIFGQGAMA